MIPKITIRWMNTPIPLILYIGGVHWHMFGRLTQCIQVMSSSTSQNFRTLNVFRRPICIDTLIKYNTHRLQHRSYHNCLTENGIRLIFYIPIFCCLDYTALQYVALSVLHESFWAFWETFGVTNHQRSISFIGNFIGQGTLHDPHWLINWIISVSRPTIE